MKDIIKTFATDPRYQQEEQVAKPSDRKDKARARSEKGDPYPQLPRRSLIRDFRPGELYPDAAEAAG